MGTLADVLTVSTVNVNGIRAAAKKGYLEWLAATSADVVCLQEVRATAEQLPEHVHSPAGWRTVLHAPAATKGRAGVTVLARGKATETRVGFGVDEFDDAGRYAEVTLPTVIVGSLYLPSGDVGTERQAEKERFMETFLPYLEQLRKRAESEGKEAVVCGDWNIAHTSADLKNWRGNQKSAGFLPEERAWLDRVYQEVGFVDVVRAAHPGVDGPYSWWSYRGRAFDNDAGWRIDLVCATPGLAEAARSAVVERAPSHESRWSDHAPVTVGFNWPKRKRS